jgi:nucleoside-diphosphate-sugar epimerase
VIVVTGAAGFIGRKVVDELHRRGQRVVGLDRRPGADHVADLTRDLDVLSFLREADAVIHLAGAAGVRRSGPGAEAAWWRDNVQATEAVLAATPLATPLVVASSSSVYGGSRGKPSSETDLLRPHGGYARSKVEVEHRCAERNAMGGHVAVARPFTVAGEGQRPDMALHRWLHAARRGEPLTILGSLHRRRDVTDVRQVAFALAELAERGVTGPVNLGTGKSHSLSDLVAAVERVVRPVDVMVKAAGQSEVEATLADTARCYRLLGFVPRTNLDELVRRQARAAGLLDPEFVDQAVGS